MDYLFTIATFISIYVVLASSLNVIVGYAGLLSIGHAALYCVGAYSSTLISLRLGFPVPLSALLAACFTALAGVLIAMPLLRLRGDYFILGSLGLQIIVVDVVRNLDGITNGPRGIANIPKPSVGGLALSSNFSFMVGYGIVALLIVLLVRYLMHGPYGRVLGSTRDDDVAADALGRNVPVVRIRAFALSAALAGFAGAMYAHFISYIDPTTFGFSESIYILSMVIIGGVATTRGPVVGAVLLVMLPEVMRFVGMSTAQDAYVRQLLYGVLLIGFAYLRPQGILGRRLM